MDQETTMNIKTDFRTNQIYLKTTYGCGCVTHKCPPPVECYKHNAKMSECEEKKRESEGKQLKLSQQDALDHDRRMKLSQMTTPPAGVPEHHEVSELDASSEERVKEQQMKEEEPRVIKHLGVGVSDNLGEHWADEVN
jgi:hypothetical protein